MSKAIEKVCGVGTFVLAADAKLAQEKSKGGLHIPDSAKKTEWFNVVSVGADCTKGYIGSDGTKKSLKPGDRIAFFQGVNVDIDGEKYMAVPEINVMTVWPKEAQ